MVKTKIVAGAITIAVFCMAWVIFAAAYAHGKPKSEPPMPTCRGEFGHKRPQSFCDK